MGSKERRDRERQATQQAILQAALEIASEESWQAMTIRRIAERIEYSPSAIYKYFDDKEAILFALLRQGFQEATGHPGTYRDTRARSSGAAALNCNSVLGLRLAQFDPVSINV